MVGEFPERTLMVSSCQTIKGVLACLREAASAMAGGSRPTGFNSAEKGG